MAAHTAPYLHDGNAKTLREAVDIMFEFQLGREAPDEDKEKIVAFIETLAGEYIDTNSRFESVQTPEAPADQDSEGEAGALSPSHRPASATAVAQGSRGKGGALSPGSSAVPAPTVARGSLGKGGRPTPTTAVAQGNRGKGGGLNQR